VAWLIILFTFELPAWVLFRNWIGIQILSGLGAMADLVNERGGVAYFAHLGGFLAGMILVKLLRPRDRYQYRRDLLW
jgi:membrane associated rhomboid family serine protease